MPLPPLLRWLVSPFASPHLQEMHNTEQINSTYIASSPTQEDRYWLDAVKCRLLAIVHLKHVCYNKASRIALPPRCCEQPGAWTNRLVKGRFVMDILPQPSDSPLKPCMTCPRNDDGSFRLLPATTEYFHRDKYSKDGLCYSCKKCRTVKTKAYNKEHQAERDAYNKRYYAKHKEEELARNARYLSTPEHLERKLEQGRQWYAKDREKNCEHARQYSHTERGKVASRANSSNRRALKRKSGGKHTLAELQELYTSQEGKCFYCKAVLGTGRGSWHADHYIPLSKGGSNAISNIVITCPTCNRKKHNKLPHDWTKELPTHLTERL